MRVHVRSKETMSAHAPRNRNVASIAHRVTVPHDIVKSSISHVTTREERSITQTTYLSTSSPLRWFATISNKNGIVSPRLTSSSAFTIWNDEGESEDVRTTLPVPSDECLDEGRLLGGDFELIRLHHIVKHHLARVFVLPFLVWSAACTGSRTRAGVRRVKEHA